MLKKKFEKFGFNLKFFQKNSMSFDQDDIFNKQVWSILF
jgi:hypothetical protein